MDTPEKQESVSKNRKYIINYKNKQRKLGRRAHLIWVTDEEYDVVKQQIVYLRNPEEIVS